jgi:hypothetical protein
MRTFT